MTKLDLCERRAHSHAGNSCSPTCMKSYSSIGAVTDSPGAVLGSFCIKKKEEPHHTARIFWDCSICWSSYAFPRRPRFPEKAKAPPIKVLPKFVAHSRWAGRRAVGEGEGWGGGRREGGEGKPKLTDTVQDRIPQPQQCVLAEQPVFVPKPLYVFSPHHRLSIGG